MKGAEFCESVMTREPFTKMHPQLAAFLKQYLAHEKVVEFNGRRVMNTHFPPYPSPAFDKMAEQFNEIGDVARRSLYSVTLAVTNRCPCKCWHCYNAGRSQQDLSLDTLRDVIAQIEAMNAVHVTLTGGEPLLRHDLPEIVRAFRGGANLSLNTTGIGLTAERARELEEAGLFAVGISLDSQDPAEHDRLRGMPGAFAAAVKAIRTVADAGLYPYIIAVARREFLHDERFEEFMRFAADCGALEVHLLEPSASGKLAGHTDVLLTAAEKKRLRELQNRVAEREDLPILSSLTYVESPHAFGCGAGLTHLYIDGSGEVCPCNLVPLSFGNVGKEPLRQILDRMGEHFCKPRTCCVGRTLARQFCGGPVPYGVETSQKICEDHLPKKHAVPHFFKIQNAAKGDVGAGELRTAYDAVHQDYDAFWLVEAAKPVDELVKGLSMTGNERVFEAGCGTGYGTARVAARLTGSGSIMAADLSEGMLSQARARCQSCKPETIQFSQGDALELLEANGPFGLIFSSWVLGYIPMEAFFDRAVKALAPGGRIAFVVHREDSPREALEIFRDIAAQDPAALEKRVAFEFSPEPARLAEMLRGRGLTVERVWDGAITFRYDSPEQVLEHLLKSGAGTAFYEAVFPERRDKLKQHFLDILHARHMGEGHLDVVHDYVSCVATKPA